MFTTIADAFEGFLSRISSKKQLHKEDLRKFGQLLQDQLLMADVPFDVAAEFIKNLTLKIEQTPCPSHLRPQEHWASLAHDVLTAHLKVCLERPLQFDAIPNGGCIMIVGLQGSGKTTSIAKLIHFLRQRNIQKEYTVTSFDFHRPAADEQLARLASIADVEYEKRSGSSMLEAARDFIKMRHHKTGITIVDTAGRMAVNQHDLDELKQTVLLVNPNLILLVLDGMTGQQGIVIAKAFSEQIKIDGLIITKMDSDALGGVAFAAPHIIGCPILWFGTGEKWHEYTIFNPDRLSSRILGRGDIASLLELAEKKEVDFQRAQQNNGDGFTFNDFLNSLQSMFSMGSLSQLLSYMPRSLSKSISSADLDRGEQELRMAQAIIASMTPKERRYPKLMQQISRQRRVAKGSGTTLENVRSFLHRFEQLRGFVKLMS